MAHQYSKLGSSNLFGPECQKGNITTSVTKCLQRTWTKKERRTWRGEWGSRQSGGEREQKSKRNLGERSERSWGWLYHFINSCQTQQLVPHTFIQGWTSPGGCSVEWVTENVYLLNFNLILQDVPVRSMKSHPVLKDLLCSEFFTKKTTLSKWCKGLYSDLF